MSESLGVKFELESVVAKIAIEAKLKELAYWEMRKETIARFSADTKDFKLQKNGIALNIQSVLEERNIAISLKTKEQLLKAALVSSDYNKIYQINEILQKKTNLWLPTKFLLGQCDFQKVIQIIKDFGFINQLFNYERKVEYYKHNASEVRLVTLGIDKRYFLEIRSNNETNLEEAMRELSSKSNNFNEENAEDRTYDQIVSSQKKKRLAEVLKKEIKTPKEISRNSSESVKSGKEVLYAIVMEAKNKGEKISIGELERRFAEQRVFKCKPKIITLIGQLKEPQRREVKEYLRVYSDEILSELSNKGESTLQIDMSSASEIYNLIINAKEKRENIIHNDFREKATNLSGKIKLNDVNKIKMKLSSLNKNDKTIAFEYLDACVTKIYEDMENKGEIIYQTKKNKPDYTSNFKPGDNHFKH